MCPKEDDWFEKGCRGATSPSSNSKHIIYTSATINKSTLLKELNATIGTNSNPEKRDKGRKKHLALERYIDLRKRGISEEEARKVLENYLPKRDKPRRLHLWGNNEKEENEIDQVVGVGNNFIAAEPHWKTVKFEKKKKKKVKGPSGEPAGNLSYIVDAQVQLPNRKGKRFFDFKFFPHPENEKITENEAVVLDLMSGRGTVNEKRLPVTPKSRVVHTDGVYGAEISLKGRTTEVKEGIVKTCLQLLLARFEDRSEDDLRTVRHRVIKEDWQKRKPKKKPDENCGIQRQLF